MVLEAQAHNTSISEAAVIALWQLISWQKRVEDSTQGVGLQRDTEGHNVPGVPATQLI